MFWLGITIGLGAGGLLGVTFMSIFQLSKNAVDDAVFSRKNDRD